VTCGNADHRPFVWRVHRLCIVPRGDWLEVLLLEAALAIAYDERRMGDAPSSTRRASRATIGVRTTGRRTGDLYCT